MKDIEKKVKTVIVEANQTYASYYKTLADEKNVVIGNNCVYYPSNAYLKMNIFDETEIHAIVIAENRVKSYTKTYINEFTDMIDSINDIDNSSNLKFQYDLINYSLSDKDYIYDVINQCVDLIDNKSKIVVDTSVMSKNIFLAIIYILNFAEKFLNCQVERIIDRVSDTSDISYDFITDITNLYDISSVIELMDTSKYNSKSAKKILKQLIS